MTIYEAVMARTRLDGERMVWVAPRHDTPPPPYGLSEEALRQIVRDSCNGGPSLAEVDARYRPARAPGPLEPALAEIVRMLESMRGGREVEALQVRTEVKAGVLTSRVSGSCRRCGDRMQVAIDGQWRDCTCSAERAAALRVDQAGLPADALEALRTPMRPWLYFRGTEDVAARGELMSAGETASMLDTWAGRVIAGEVMDKPVLLMGGVYRAGKSWAAMRLGLKLCHARVSVRWRDMVSLLAQMRKGIDTGVSSDDIIEVLASASVRCLILDDLGAGGGGSDWYTQIFDGLIGRRVEHRRPLIITSNVARRDLGGVLGTRLAMRVLERCESVSFGGEPKRS